MANLSWLIAHVVVCGGVWVCWLALTRWQAKVLKRERGEQPEGFPVLPPRKR